MTFVLSDDSLIELNQHPTASTMPPLNTQRTSNFSLVGSHKISLASLGQSKFPLDKMKFEGKIRRLLGDEFQEKVPFLSPLEGNIYLQLDSESHSNVQHQGFLVSLFFVDSIRFDLSCILSCSCPLYFLYCRQQHTTLHTTAGLLLKLSIVGPGQSLDGRPDAAGSGVGGPVGGTLSSGLKISQCPRAVIGDTALCRVSSFGWDVKRVSCLSEVIKDPVALIVRVGVLTPPSPWTLL
ncbi:unnamed protein product, partial [Oncorhynchus mykiss]